MNNEFKLFFDYVIPCLNELYKCAQSVFNFPVDFTMIGDYAPYMDFGNGVKDRHDVYGCFYISEDERKRIVKQYTNDFEEVWTFPYDCVEYKKGEEFEALKKDYEENPDDDDLKAEYERTLEFMEHDRLYNEYVTKMNEFEKQFNEGKLNRKKFMSIVDKVAKEYGCTKRSPEKEAIENTIREFSPNEDYDFFETVRNYYMAGASDALVGADTPDFNRLALEEAKAGRAFLENIKNNKKTIYNE